MPRIRVKDHKPNSGNRKLLLWNKCMQLNLLVYKLTDTGRNSFVILSSVEVIERILSNSIKENLQKERFEIIIPPEYNASRTIVLRNIDPLITKVDNEELKATSKGEISGWQSPRS